MAENVNPQVSNNDSSKLIGRVLLAVILGEGGSGGAVAIATCNRVIMLEHAIYTVASPEASASILWRDSGRAQDAATSMKITVKFEMPNQITPSSAQPSEGKALSSG